MVDIRVRTPRSLVAEEHTTGATLPSRIPSRKPRWISSSLSVPASRYFSRSESSLSAAASINCPRYSSASFSMSFGTTPDGKGGEGTIPEGMLKLVDEYRGQLIEAAAESDDSLLEKYLDAGTLSEEEIQRGLRQGILDGKVAPVVCCSATKLLGVRTLMATIAELMPPPEAELDKPVKAFVFSTGGDQFGRVSYFKVVAGTVKADAHLTNLNRGSDERLAQIFFPRGKEHVSATEIKAGDIGAVTKLTHTLSGDTLGSKDGGPLE